jgi:hypothetical protein
LEHPLVPLLTLKTILAEDLKNSFLNFVKRKVSTAQAPSVCL